MDDTLSPMGIKEAQLKTSNLNNHFDRNAAPLLIPQKQLFYK